MSITYRDQTYPGLQDYVERQKRNRLLAPDGTPLYAHPVDERILRTLNATPVRAAMTKALDMWVSFHFGHEIAQGVSIDPKSFPVLFDVLTHCARTLGIPPPHTIARHDSDLFNAYTAGSDEYAFISISSALCEFYSTDEARFIIGHECGHIAAAHMLYHTLAGIVADATSAGGALLRFTAGIPLLAWSRRSEVTADRAGLLCCGRIEVAEYALLRLVTGFADVNRVDIEDYLAKARGLEQFHPSSRLHQLFQQHPLIPKRIEALRLFARSELFYELVGRTPPPAADLLTRTELDRLVNRVIAP